MAWVLRLVAVDVVILTLWMIVGGPTVAVLGKMHGYAGKSTLACYPGLVRTFVEHAVPLLLCTDESQRVTTFSR